MAPKRQTPTPTLSSSSSSSSSSPPKKAKTKNAKTKKTPINSAESKAEMDANTAAANERHAKYNLKVPVNPNLVELDRISDDVGPDGILKAIRDEFTDFTFRTAKDVPTYLPPVPKQKEILIKLRAAKGKPLMNHLVKMGSPFVLTYCNHDLDEVYPRFIVDLPRDDRMKMGFTGTCKRCNTAGKTSSKIVGYVGAELEERQAYWKEIIDAVPAVKMTYKDGSRHTFSPKKAHQRITLMLTKGDRRGLAYVETNGVDGMYACKGRCGECKFFYEFVCDPLCPAGFRPACILCHNRASRENDPTAYRAGSMKACGKRRSAAGRTDMPDVPPTKVLMTIGDICAKTGLRTLSADNPYDRVNPFFDALRGSSERIANGVCYENNNVKNICRVFNVGHTGHFPDHLIVSCFFRREFAKLVVPTIPYDPQFMFRPKPTDYKKPYDYKSYQYVKALLNSAKSHAADRDKVELNGDPRGICTLTEEDILASFDHLRPRCEISGIHMLFVQQSPYSASLDRPDPTQGYTKENARLVLQCFNDSITWTRDLFEYFFGSDDGIVKPHIQLSHIIHLCEKNGIPLNPDGTPNELTAAALAVKPYHDYRNGEPAEGALVVPMPNPRKKKSPKTTSE